MWFNSGRTSTQSLKITEEKGQVCCHLTVGQGETRDLKALNSGSKLGSFEFPYYWYFGCKIARAFSSACSLNLIFVGLIWA